MKIKQKCSICDVNDWEYLEYLRDQKHWYNQDYLLKDEPTGFKACKNCGFITYDYVETERLLERYNRSAPVFEPNNLITCARKNLYHERFLKDPKIKLPIFADVLDIGCAHGAFLNWVAEEMTIDRSNLEGTEYRAAHRAYGKHEYGINITEDLTEKQLSKKYDMITYYHVLEHVQHPFDELQKAKGLLKENGYLYISVPVWFEQLQESALEPITVFENHYHLNHISVFTPASFENLLQKAKLKVVKSDRGMYGYTVLCQVDESIKNDKIQTMHIEDIKRELEAQKEAIELFNDKKHMEAVKVYPKFPEAYMQHSLIQENLKDFEKQKEIIGQGLSEMPDNITLQEQYANIHFQFDQNTPDKFKFYSNNIRRAEELFLQCLEQRPSDKAFFFLGLINGVYKKDYKAAIDYLKKSSSINLHGYFEAVKWIGKFCLEMENESNKQIKRGVRERFILSSFPKNGIIFLLQDRQYS